MKTLQEMKLLVRMKRHLKEDVPQELLDQIAAEEARLAAEEQKKLALQEERKAAFKATFADLSKEINKLVAEEKQKTAEEQALLDRFANVLTRIDEIKAAQPEQIIPEVVEDQPEEVVEEVTPQPEVIEEKAPILAPVEEPSLAKEVAKKIKKKDQPPSMFVQPEPEVTSRDLKEIQRKIQLMEGWVSKISMAGPGGGAVWLRDLDDVARSSVLGATDGQVLTYNESIKKWTAQDPASGSGGSGYVLPTASTTVKGGVKVDGSTIVIANGVISSPDQDLSGLQTTEGLAANVATLTANNTLYLGGIAANQYAYANAVYSQISWFNPSPNPGSPFRTSVTAGSGKATIDIQTGMPQFGSTLTWTFDETTITFPDNTKQSTAFTGNANNASYLGGVAANQYAYANQITTYTLPTANTSTLGGVKVDGTTVTIANGTISATQPNLSGYQTIAGLAANVATLASNNTLYLGGIAANQYAYANAIPSLTGYQTTAGLSANVATLTANNANYLGGVAAANYVANTDSRTLSGNLVFTGLMSVNYTGSGNGNASITIGGYNSKGGTGYHDFLKVTNGYGSATNPTKWFRLNSVGELQIINNAYTSQLLVLSDAGDLTILGNITSSGVKSGYSSGRPGFRVYGSGTTNNLGTTVNTSGALNSSNFAVDFNQGTYLNASTGVFTAPVAGLYQVNIVGRNSGAAVYSQLSVVKNASGGTGSGGSIACMIEWAASSSMNHTGAGTVLQLAANDTLCLKVTAGNVNFDQNDNWSVAYIG